MVLVLAFWEEAPLLLVGFFLHLVGPNVQDIAE